jgi:hypothetical protein
MQAQDMPRRARTTVAPLTLATKWVESMVNEKTSNEKVHTFFKVTWGIECVVKVGRVIPEITDTMA